eukprot:COSAG06_NODE_55203_length_290_cov_2.109948_1_plen_36_part_01
MQTIDLPSQARDKHVHGKVEKEEAYALFAGPQCALL